MGARFDRWLARPTTLHFLRQLIGPEPAVVRTKRPHWNTLPKNHTRCYSAAQPGTATHISEHASDDRISHAAAAAASIETFHEQRERVAQELGLHIFRTEDDERAQHQIGSTPSSTSYSDLLYSEARVRDFSAARGLLIDEPVNHANMEAWCKILEYRKRTDGLAGIMDVWDGMRDRSIDLPIEGKHADTLWTTFIKAAVFQEPDESRDRLLEGLVTHAKELKASGSGHYRSFHKALIGRFLRILPGGARKRSLSKSPDPEYEVHQSACESGLCDVQSVPSLAMDVLKSTKPRLALARWQKLYLHDKQYFNNDSRGMYDLCMPHVLLRATDNPLFVFAWHDFLALQDDMPGRELASNRSVAYLLSTHDARKIGSRPSQAQLRELTAKMAEDRSDAQSSTSPILSRASMNSLVGDVHGIKPKGISDKFCARMFATQAFSLETSIRGLALLGTEALGPVALRELAIRANTIEILEERLADVKDAGIAISPSTYAHVLRTVLADSQIDLFHTLLASDQHPESYDDPHTQETLLSNFLQVEDWPSAHVTLIALSHADPAKASRAWNRLLQHYIKNQNYKEIVRIFDHMCSEQLLVNSRSLNFMMVYLLATRVPSKRPMVASNSPDDGFVSINFVVNAHMYAASLGQVLNSERWIELLKRYGMTGNMKGIERLVPWLVKRYPRSAEKNHQNGIFEPLTTDKSRQAKILNPIMLRALIIWGFQYEGRRNRLRPAFEKSKVAADVATPAAPWTRGIALVSYLKSMGVNVQKENVRRAVVGVLWTIFGPGVSKRKSNMELIRRNELTIMDYVKDANEAWEEPLFDISPQDVNTETSVIRAVFGSHRLADQKTGDWVDIEAWMVAKETGAWWDPGPDLPDRYEAWSRSEFRFKDDFATRRQRQLANLRRNQTPSKSHSPRKQQHDTTIAQVNPPRRPQPAAQPLNWRPLSSQPDTREEP